MKVALLAAGYLVIGVVVAARARRDPTDTLLLVTAWPLYGPFLWIGEDDALAAVLGRAQGTALSPFLPEPEVAARLARRIEAARARVRAVEQLARDPRFDRAALEARVAQLSARGHAPAVAAARESLRNLDRLEALRARGEAELDEITERVRQLQTLVELARLSATPADGADALVADLLDRVDGLEAFLADPVLAGAPTRGPSASSPTR